MKIADKTNIEDCEISVRLINSLKTNGIDTIGDLIRKEPLFFAKHRFRVSVVKELERKYRLPRKLYREQNHHQQHQQLVDAICV